MHQAARSDGLVLIEATCNQVNPYGGYTGMTPADFADYIAGIARRVNLPNKRILLGGDHLGPFPWQDEPVEAAMAKAVAMVRAYVQAGFGKIHLDASMRCADDNPSQPLAQSLSAARAAEMCRAAEDAYTADTLLARPVYVIGTEVPVPGGTQEKEESLQTTSPIDAAATIEAFRLAFEQKGLQEAWKRVIALVVQPGVEFSDEDLFEYDRSKTRRLSKYIETVPNMIYEAHSTDYQQAWVLRQMVEDHFAILKVGPALTFAVREAVFALGRMEVEWLGEHPDVTLSHIIETLETAMLANPKYWEKYYAGQAQAATYARKYSQSDRIRYFWNEPDVETALARLLTNLEKYPLPRTLISQYLPVQYAHQRGGMIGNSPRELIWDHILEVLEGYNAACRLHDPVNIPTDSNGCPLVDNEKEKR